MLRQPSFNVKVLKGLVGARLPRVKFSHFATLEIPRPPLEEQERIVAELEGYRKVIEAAR